MRKVFAFISMVVMTTLFSSCATIVSGGDPSITINSSSVFEPVTITTEKQSYPNVTLPAVVQVKRKKLDGQRIRIEAENYKFEDIVLRKAVNGWAFGNILLGGLIGWSIDLMTNQDQGDRSLIFFEQTGMWKSKGFHFFCNYSWR